MSKVGVGVTEFCLERAESALALWLWLPHGGQALVPPEPSGPGLLQLLMLASNSEPADVDGDGDDDLGVPGGLPCLGIGIAGLHAFPLGPAVLEPDFYLHLAEFEGVGDLRALGQREVLFAVELLLQLQELLAGEGSPPPPVLARRRGAACGAAARRGLLQRVARVFLLVSSLARKIVIRAVVQIALQRETLLLALRVVFHF